MLVWGHRWHLPTIGGRLLETRVEFFDLERDGGVAANSFYRWFRYQGFQLHLTPRRFDEWEATETAVLERDLNLFKYELLGRHLPISLADFDAAALLDECGLFEEDDGEEAE